MSQFYYNINYNINFGDESLTFPDFFNFSDEISSDVSMIYGSGHFYRNNSNSNIIINVGLGTDISPGLIYMSSDILLPINTFNVLREVPEIIFPNNQYARMLSNLDFYHDIMIQFKITKANDLTFTNHRELRATLVRSDNSSVYDASIYANNQPEPGVHDMLIIKGKISHLTGDDVKLKLNLVQDTENDDQDNTKLTIFRISWNIMALKK